MFIRFPMWVSQLFVRYHMIIACVRCHSVCVHLGVHLCVLACLLEHWITTWYLEWWRLSARISQNRSRKSRMTSSVFFSVSIYRVYFFYSRSSRIRSATINALMLTIRHSNRILKISLNSGNDCVIFSVLKSELKYEFNTSHTDNSSVINFSFSSLQS